MATAMSLHVGINKASVTAFKDNILLGCVHDAEKMQEIAEHRGFETKLLTNEEATFANVVVEILRAAEELEAGGIFLFTFAGHGTFRPDKDEQHGVSAEFDGQDEALVLFDRLILDDYVRRVLWPEFKKGVRIVGVVDGCHSGTAIFSVPEFSAEFIEELSVSVSEGPGGLIEVVSSHTAETVVSVSVPGLPGNGYTAEVTPTVVPAPALVDNEDPLLGGFRDRGLLKETIKEHREEYRAIYKGQSNAIAETAPSPAAAEPVKADLLIIAACRDDEKTKDGPDNGAFTKVLFEVWQGVLAAEASGGPADTYLTFMDKISQKIKQKFPDQNPQLRPEQPPAFSSQRPFTITI